MERLASQSVLCTGCRALLAPGERCDLCDGAPRLSLIDPDERARATALSSKKVTIPQPMRIEFRGIALLAVAAALVAATILVARHATTFADSLGAGVLAGAALAAIVALATVAHERWRGRRDRPTTQVPLGAARTPDRPPSLASLEGTIAGERRVVASAFELRDQNDRPIAIGAATDGFELALNDGRTVVVPAGRARLLRGRAKLEQTTLFAFLNEPEPFPRARVYAWSLRGGDAVVAHGDWEERAPEGDRGYRRSSIATLRPRGIVWLARL